MGCGIRERRHGIPEFRSKDRQKVGKIRFQQRHSNQKKKGDCKKKKGQIGGATKRFQALRADECGKDEKESEGKHRGRGVEKRRVDKFFHIQNGQKGGEKEIEREERVEKENAFSERGVESFRECLR